MAKADSHVHFVLVGTDVDEKNEELSAQVESLGLTDFA